MILLDGLEPEDSSDEEGDEMSVADKTSFLYIEDKVQEALWEEMRRFSACAFDS